MNREIIGALQELGVDITDVQYKYPPEDSGFAFGDDEPTKFVLKGSFLEEDQLKRIFDEIFIIRAMHGNANPAVQDLYNKLRITIGITDNVK